jgi:hypothetical protein
MFSWEARETQGLTPLQWFRSQTPIASQCCTVGVSVNTFTLVLPVRSSERDTRTRSLQVGSRQDKLDGVALSSSNKAAWNPGNRGETEVVFQVAVNEARPLANVLP